MIATWVTRSSRLVHFSWTSRISVRRLPYRENVSVRDSSFVLRNLVIHTLANTGDDLDYVCLGKLHDLSELKIRQHECPVVLNVRQVLKIPIRLEWHLLCIKYGTIQILLILVHYVGHLFHIHIEQWSNQFIKRYILSYIKGKDTDSFEPTLFGKVSEVELKSKSTEYYTRNEHSFIIILNVETQSLSQ